MTKSISIVFLLCLAASVSSHAQKLTTLASFDGSSNGADPAYGFLVQGFDGNLYGTTPFGGLYLHGNIFKITPQGTLTTVASFSGLDGVGQDPSGAVAPTLQGNFYGTTSGNAGGTVFKVTPDGTLTTINKFVDDSGGGTNPFAGLILASNGNFYGTASTGGANSGGTVFKITPAGTLTTEYSFCAQRQCTDGWSPIAGLVQGTDGNLYGTTPVGGANCVDDSGCGTVFKITPEGALTTLYSFCAQTDCTDGEAPDAALVQAPDGSLYGTTYQGGSSASCDGGCGTIFKISVAGTLTTLYNFCSQNDCTDGAAPFAALVRGTDGNFYGTTYQGGTAGFGTVFKLTADSALTTLYSFCSRTDCTDGSSPYAGLVQATDGLFYGTTNLGGTNNYGTIFSLNVGLGRFVETLPSSGAVGRTIDILSQGLTGTTAVSFNGTAASFTVVSDTYLTATIPSGATTGFVSVTTPSATLKSNLKFRVVP
jgi:uncharacterized repeat protein (TIGR03803 family)